ncbi:cystatin-like [Aulostomus maculatus]
MWKLSLAILAAAAAAAVGSMSLVGGFRDVDVNDERVKNALNFALVKHNNASNDMYLRQVSKVVSAQAQVVSGLKYVLTVELSRTTCRKSHATEVCDFHEDPRPYTCTFTVWSRPWINDIQVKEKC